MTFNSTFLARLASKDSDARLALLANEAPRVPWDVFTHSWFDPEPGEHTGIIGPTGQGKTLLQKNILPKYPFVAAFATKPQDITMERLITQGGYVRLAQWHGLNPIDHPRRVIWPDATRIDSYELQRNVFQDAFSKIFREGGRPKDKPVGWAIAIDELWYVCNVLKLSMEVKVFLLQGRSIGHSLVMATQRPKHVPLEVYDQSTHLFFFRDNDRDNLDRLGAIQARDSQLVRLAVSGLEEHQVLYINTRTGVMARTRIPIGMRWVKGNE
jgi:hypothetical protein